MNRAIVVLVAVLALATVLGSQSAEASVKSFCAERWRSEPAAQKACFNRQAAGNDWVQAFMARRNIRRKIRAVAAGRAKAGPYLNMFDHCTDRWGKIRRHNTYNFKMLARCIRDRESAYRAKLRAAQRSDRVLGRLEAVAMIKKMPNISTVAWADGGKDSHLNVDVEERGQDYASDSRAYCDILKTKGVQKAKVSVWSADAKKKSPPKEVLLTHRRC